MLPLIPIALIGFGVSVAAKVIRSKSSKNASSSGRSNKSYDTPTAKGRTSYSGSSSHRNDTQQTSARQYGNINVTEEILSWNNIEPHCAERSTYRSNNNNKIEYFFSEAELKVMPSYAKNIVLKIISNCPKFKRNNFSLDDAGDIFIGFGNYQKNTLYDFIKTIDKEKDRLWVNIHKEIDKKTGAIDEYIVFYNENESILIVEPDNDENYLDLSEVYSGKRMFRAGKIIRGLGSPVCSIPASRLHFISHITGLDIDIDIEDPYYLYEYIHDYNKLNSLLVENKQRMWEKGKEDAVAFEAQKEYLKFQQIKENQPVSILLPQGRKHKRTINDKEEEDSYTGISYQLDITEEEFSPIAPDERFGYTPVEVLHLDGTKIQNANKKSSKWSCYGKIFLESGCPVLQLNLKSTLSEQELMNGVKIVKRPNDEYYTKQISAIEYFTNRNNHSSIFYKLYTGELKQANEVKDIQFINENLNNAEQENSQPLAVRRALGNQDVVLIQGPPGTGKTTVIVEIIEQLVKKHQRILVCSQTHAAVDNIKEKIAGSHSKIEYVDIRENHRNFIQLDKDEFKNYIQNVDKEIDLLLSGTPSNSVTELANSFKYDSPQSVKFDYNTNHKDIISNFQEEREILEIYKDIVENLDSSNLNENMLELAYFRSRDVILGTCIGIGLNQAFKRGNIKFDVVIIDEAAKANLSEALVPMSLGKKFILVGDDNQLPAYLDSKIFNDFRNLKRNEEPELYGDYFKAKELLSASLFSFLNEHSNGQNYFKFPNNNVTLLNTQYRMHPDIGKLISDLFYEGKLRMGDGTDRKVLPIDNLQGQFRCFDIRGKEGRAFDSFNNPDEARFIVSQLLPSIIETIEGTDLTLGIITPYSSQRKEIRDLIKTGKYKDCVYTIDSIQGKEYDIVIFSFVRSFPIDVQGKVGFIDDMRRLNVALSRARKKLLVVGNVETLTNPNNHYPDRKGDPRVIFSKLLANSSKIEKDSNTSKFLSNYTEGEIIKASFSLEHDEKKIKEEIYVIRFQKDDIKYVFKSHKFKSFQDIASEGEGTVYLTWMKDDNNRPDFKLAISQYLNVGSSYEGVVHKDNNNYYIISINGFNCLLPKTGYANYLVGDKLSVVVQDIPIDKPMPRVAIKGKAKQGQSQIQNITKPIGENKLLCNPEQFALKHSVGQYIYGEVFKKIKDFFIIQFPDGVGLLPQQGYEDFNIGDKDNFYVDRYQKGTNVPYLEYFGTL